VTTTSIDLGDRVERTLRALFVLPFAPRFDIPHGGRVIAQLLDRLLDREDIGILYLGAPGSPPIDPAIEERCVFVRRVLAPDDGRRGLAWLHRWRVLSTIATGLPTAVGAVYSRELLRAVSEIAQEWDPDVIQIEHDSLAFCAPAPGDSAAVTVLVCHDPGLGAAEDLARVTTGRQRVSHRLDALAWRRYWRRTLVKMDMVVTFTERDAHTIEAVVPGAETVAIPLGIEIPTAAANPIGSDPSTVTFIGGYRHPPNADAARRLIMGIMPMVRRHRPQQSLALVGQTPTNEMRRRAGPHDEVTGEVPRVEPYMEHAALIVLPIRLGGGMRVKLLEALAAGKAVVASPLAAAGLDVIDGEHLRLAVTDEDFAAIILELLADEDGRGRLGRQARVWAEANLRWESRAERYEQLYRSLLVAADPNPRALVNPLRTSPDDSP
jgi:glycosyltransferase involved in cell wall biosynthesis